MKHEIFLDFAFWDFDGISHDMITDMLDIKPVKTYIKGERLNPNFLTVAKRNGWRMASGLDKHASFEDQMNAILDIIEPKIELFRGLCAKYYSEFSCAVFIRYNNGESIPSIHLSERYNNIVKELNAEFDLDLYCLPNAFETTA